MAAFRRHPKIFQAEIDHSCALYKERALPGTPNFFLQELIDRLGKGKSMHLDSVILPEPAASCLKWTTLVERNQPGWLFPLRPGTPRSFPIEAE
jgi:hypothetical protein